jgi:oligopeptide transport system ATP-binding protein
MGLERPTAGSIKVLGQEMAGLDSKGMRKMRRNIQIVLQDPYSSLDPRMTVGDIVGEPYEVHTDVVKPKDRRKAVQDLLDVVGLNPDHINRYPHQFSGGQRQRIGIARALALKPKIIVADEPVSALDVSVQAQVVNLFERLQDEFGLSYVFIAHDLSVVRHISDRVMVMYLGKAVEIGDEHEIYDGPTHPYTQALLSAVPVPDPRLRGHRDQIVLEGDVPSPANPPSGCRFRTRCWMAQDICATEEPMLVNRDGSAHPSACHFAAERDVVHAVDNPIVIEGTTPDNA